MANPTYTLEVAFSTTNPLTTSPTWTDISAYLISFDLRRGKDHELASTQAGSLDLVLLNRDRRFEPLFAAGAYSPNVLPMKQIRLRATFSSITYDLFRGFVIDWGQDWGDVTLASKGVAEAHVRAVDGFSVLSHMNASTYQSEVLADSPIVYWPLTDPPTSIGPGTDLGSNASPPYFREVNAPDSNFSSFDGSFGRAAAPFLATSGETSLDSTSTAAGPAVGSINGFSSGNVDSDPFSVEFWLLLDAALVASSQVVRIVALPVGYSKIFDVDANASGALTVTWDTNDGAIDSRQTSNVLTSTGVWYHVVVTRAGSRVVVYVNGAAVSTFTGCEPVLAKPYPQGFGRIVCGYHVDGAYAHLAIYDQALAPSRVAAHYAATVEPLVQDQSGQALTYLLAAVGWPTGLQTLAPGSSRVTVGVPSGSVLTTLLNVAEDSEHGLFYAAGDGKLTFIEREALQARTSSATFGDSGADIPYEKLAVRYDDQDLWTEVDSKGAGGLTATASDATAKTSFGTRTLSEDTLVDDGNELQDHADGLLLTYKAAALRPSSMDLAGVGSVVQQLSRTLGDQITVHRNPPGGGAQMSFAALIEGIQHHSDPGLAGRLVSTFSLVPAPSGTAAGVPWILGDSTNGVLDSTTDLGW